MEQTEIMAEHTSSSHAGQQGGGAFLVTTLTIRDRERTVYAFMKMTMPASCPVCPQAENPSSEISMWAR